MSEDNKDEQERLDIIGGTRIICMAGADVDEFLDEDIRKAFKGTNATVDVPVMVQLSRNLRAMTEELALARTDGWIKGNGPPSSYKGWFVATIRHCNLSLYEKDREVLLKWGDDGAYFEDGGELANNWDIIRWKKL